MRHHSHLCIHILQNSPEVQVSSQQLVPTASIFQFLAVCELGVLSCGGTCEISYLSLGRQHPELRQSAE